jgi:hypothetical protein
MPFGSRCVHDALQGRLWDLLPEIRSHTYHSDYRGSFLLKDVLLAMVPAMTYQDVEVAEGNAAGMAWERIVPGQLDEAEKQNCAPLCWRTASRTRWR